MKLICKEARSHEEAKAFVDYCEKEFTEKLRSASAEALSGGRRIITLSGPTCSGKTTTAAIMISEIARAGKNAVVISIDDFYLDDLRVNIGDGQKIDFDSVSTIDLEYLRTVVHKLSRGESVMMPRFDFLTGRREGYERFDPTEDDIYIFEGIQAVYPEVTSLLGDRYTSVFICVRDDVVLNGVYFASDEIRLLRRLVRDHLFRNTPPEKTLHYWESVRENERANIFPNAKNSHVEIDSFLMYELFVTSPMVLELLRDVPETSKYYDVVCGLVVRLEKIDGTMFDPSLVPEKSMFREFIG